MSVQSVHDQVASAGVCRLERVELVERGGREVVGTGGDDDGPVFRDEREKDAEPDCFLVEVEEGADTASLGCRIAVFEDFAEPSPAIASSTTMISSELSESESPVRSITSCFTLSKAAFAASCSATRPEPQAFSSCALRSAASIRKSTLSMIDNKYQDKEDLQAQLLLAGSDRIEQVSLRPTFHLRLTQC